ncbi:hypothetical protein V8F06_007247 [Rhypophila decipiens]
MPIASVLSYRPSNLYLFAFTCTCTCHCRLLLLHLVFQKGAWVQFQTSAERRKEKGETSCPVARLCSCCIWVAGICLVSALLVRLCQALPCVSSSLCSPQSPAKYLLFLPVLQRRETVGPG